MWMLFLILILGGCWDLNTEYFQGGGPCDKRFLVCSGQPRGCRCVIPDGGVFVDIGLQDGLVMPPDLFMPPAPCQDIGMVAGHYYACAGLLGGAHPVASVQCSSREPGSAPCTTMAGVDSAKASALAGVFLVNQGLAVFSGGSNNCSPTQVAGAIDLGWFGLGNGSGLRSAATACNGFLAYESNSATPGWHSSDFPPGLGNTMKLDNVSSTRATDGVACCR